MGMIKMLTRTLLPFVGGNIIGNITAKEAPKDYGKFEKPPYSPPRYAFPIVWPILYLCMGVAYNLVKGNGTNTKAATVTHYTQLSLNFLWSLLYFKKKVRGIALIESFILLIAVTTNVVVFFKNKPISGILLFPYVLWSSYASYLNTGNWLLNKDNPEYSKGLCK